MWAAPFIIVSFRSTCSRRLEDDIIKRSVRYCFVGSARSRQLKDDNIMKGVRQPHGESQVSYLPLRPIVNCGKRKIT